MGTSSVAKKERAGVHCISASGMLSSKMKNGKQRVTSRGLAADCKKRKILLCLVFLAFSMLYVPWALLYAEITDRVVAFIDNTAITYSELEMQYAKTVKITPNISKEEVLNTMINRMLLIGEAEKMKLEAPSEDELLKEYINLKIRAFIRIPEADLRSFYDQHLQKFQEREFDDVREDIENYLIELEVNERLRSHISELRHKYCIQIQLK